MPLFACSECNSVENTALGSYWYPASKGQPVLCSACNDGEWHDSFPRERADNGKWEPDAPLRPQFLRPRKAA